MSPSSRAFSDIRLKGLKQLYGAPRPTRRAIQIHIMNNHTGLRLRPTNSTVSQPIELNEEYLEQMQRLQPSLAESTRAGYRLHQWTADELHAKRRCGLCSKVMKPTKEERLAYKTGGHYGDDPTDDAAPSIYDDIVPVQPKSVIPGPKSSMPKAVCFSHPGRWDRQARKYTCCNRNGAGTGCLVKPVHQVYPYAPGELATFWQLHPTSASYKSFNHRAAVAIDCEMGTTVMGDSDLIRVSLVDYFTGTVLVDNLVWPDIQMEHYNTKYSGVSKKDMESARRAGTCIFGRDNARMACQQFVGPNTIIVGHGAQNDLLSLRWIHYKIIDTYLIESAKIKAEEGLAVAAAAAEVEALAIGEGQYAHPEGGVRLEAPSNVDAESTGMQSQQANPKLKKKPKGTGRLALKTLTKERLGRDIQSKDRIGHDSVEDAVAARDLVHSYVMENINNPRPVKDPNGGYNDW